MIMENDQIETDRLSLRAPCLADADAITASLQNWDIIRRLASPPYPFTRQDAVNWLGDLARDRADGSVIAFAIYLDDTHIGVVDVGLKDDIYALGYWLAQDHWGKGYMSEAVQALLAHVFRDENVDLVTSNYFVENPKSGHVLKKAGFTTIGRTDIWSNPNGAEVPSHVVRLTRERWMELNQ